VTIRWKQKGFLTLQIHSVGNKIVNKIDKFKGQIPPCLGPQLQPTQKASKHLRLQVPDILYLFSAGLLILK
jgi:hypothetical protein